MSKGERHADVSGGAGSSARPRPRAWPEAWMRAVLDLASVSAERRAVVLDDIEIGSQPTGTYYALLGVSELIAGFALIIGSDATLIGANVVAPLMTPIIGVSLGLMRSDLRLLRTALIAEFGGALVGVVLTYLLGLMPFWGDPTPSLLAQTHPTLIDLLVAALAGFAGVLAMIDERVSPALPGVAIATALNPPVAAIGLCLAFGAYRGAWGAFLLFFANVLAILAVAAVLFLIAGFVTWAEIGSLRGLARRFAPAAIGLVLVTALLTNYLVGMVTNIRLRRTITAVLDHELAREPSTALVAVDFSRGKEEMEVLSEVRTPRVIEPGRVKQIQDALGSRLAEPVRLFMRCALTKDVTATGSTTLRPYLSLNGRVATAPISPDMRLLQQAEQVAREVVANRADIDLKDVELVNFPSGPVLVASIESPRPPNPANIARFEALLRERLGEESIRVVVRVAESVDITSKGRVLFGEAHFGALSADEAQRQAAVEEAVRAQLQALPDTFVTAIDAVYRDPGWAVRAEVVAPRVLAPGDVHAVEERVRNAVNESVDVTVRARTDVLVTGKQYQAAGAATPTPQEDPAPTPESP
ncbi:MAG: DUF389 domain-containing protein [Deltaproteobacteria bacterium]|nr:MAG: DUF389 domain-containing protein [Deltaproteobacteria bacterium]